MKAPKSHHFVPQWYLKKFVDAHSGFLHVYDTNTQSFRKQRPREVMTINRYYQQKHTPEGMDPDIFEKMLGSTLEPEAKKAFDKLLTQPKAITEADTANILAYLELQRIRVPRQAETAKTFTKEALLHLALDAPPGRLTPEVKSALLRGELIINVHDAIRFDFMKTLFGQLTRYFARMVWEIHKVEEGCCFITSDSPVSFYNVAILPPAEAGLAFVGTLVLFPLDSRHLLILHHPEYTDSTMISPLEIISPPKLGDGKIEVVHGLYCSEEKVNSFNWVILQLSERIIVGRSKEILKKALDHHV